MSKKIAETENSEEPEEEAEQEEDGRLEKEEVDQTLIDKALRLVRVAVHGNGMEPHDVTVADDGFEGEVLNFEAFSFFKVETELAKKRMNGRQNADEVAGSETDMQAKIKGFVETVTKNKQVKEQTIDLLNYRDDIGFGLDNHVVYLDRQNKSIAVYETCHICHCSKTIKCQLCHGQGRVSCHECHGSQDIQCPQCQGKQFIAGQQDRPQLQCPTCSARGRIDCYQCRGMGQIQCKTCSATGKMTCQECAGTGWHTVLAHIKIRARSRFDYDREALPEDASSIIDDLGPALFTEGHADISFIEDYDYDEELDLESQDDEYIIPYQVRLPIGDIRFDVKDDESLEGKLFGFQPVLLDMPDFLETLIKTGIGTLDEAAHGAVNITEKIKESADYRAISDIFIAAARQGQTNAGRLIKERYPVGIPGSTVDRMILLADRALKRVTKKPRYIGLLVGLVLVTFLYGFYYLGPLRSMLMIYIPGSSTQVLVDLVIVLLGGSFTTLSIQISARKALKDAIGSLFPKQKKQSLMPKAGRSALWGYLGGIIIYFMILESTRHVGSSTPEWYVELLAVLGGGG